MENEVVVVPETNPNLEIIKEAALRGAVAGIVTVVVTKLATALIDKSVEKVTEIRKAKNTLEAA